MKLHHDCVRDVLIAIEEHCGFSGLRSNIFELPELVEYRKDDVIYTLQKLNEAGFVNGKIIYDMSGNYMIDIRSLTYNGHQFLDTVRDPVVWKHIKEKSAAFASVSLPTLMEIGKSYLNQMLGL